MVISVHHPLCMFCFNPMGQCLATNKHLSLCWGDTFSVHERSGSWVWSLDSVEPWNHWFNWLFYLAPQKKGGTYITHSILPSNVMVVSFEEISHRSMGWLLKVHCFVSLGWMLHGRAGAQQMEKTHGVDKKNNITGIRYSTKHPFCMNIHAVYH